MAIGCPCTTLPGGPPAHIVTLEDTAANGTSLARTYVLDLSASTLSELKRTKGRFDLGDPAPLQGKGPLQHSVSIKYDAYTTRAVGITADGVFLADPQLRTSLSIDTAPAHDFQHLKSIASNGRGKLYVADSRGVWQLRLPIVWEALNRASYQKLFQEQPLEPWPAYLDQVPLRTAMGGPLRPPAWLQWEERLGLILGYETAILCVAKHDLVNMQPSIVPSVIFGDGAVADGREEGSGDNRGEDSESQMADSDDSLQEGSSGFSSMVVDSAGAVIVSHVQASDCTRLIRGELAAIGRAIVDDVVVHFVWSPVQQLAMLPSGHLAAVSKEGLEVVDMGLVPRAEPGDQLGTELAQLLHSQPVSPHDVTLVVGEQQYGAHKAILAARSMYCRSLLDPNSGFADAGTQTINLPPADPRAVQLVLHFMYTNKLDPTLLQGQAGGGPAHMVLATAMELADRLQVPSMGDQLMAPLMDMVTPDNVVDLLLWADARSVAMGRLLGLLIEWYSTRYDDQMACVRDRVGRGDRAAVQAAEEWARLWQANRQLAFKVLRAKP